MKTKKMHIVGVIAAIMGFIMLALFFISVSPVIKSVEPNNSLIRTMQVEQITNGEQIENLISKFDYYDTSYDDTSIYFEGVMAVAVNNSDNISSANDTLDKKFKTRYDYTTNEFFVEVSLFDEGVLVDSWEKVATPNYDEELDEGYLELDGEKVYISECFDDSVIDNCFAPAAAAVGVGAVCVFAVAAVVIMAVPTSAYEEIGYKIEQIVETVVEAVKSFWSWLKRWVKKTFTRTVVTETTTTVHVPTMIIDGVKFEARAKSKAEVKALPRTDAEGMPIYYLAYASGIPNQKNVEDTSLKEGEIFIGNPLTLEQAISVLTTPEVTVVEVTKELKFSYVPSIFSYYESDIIDVMDFVGYHEMTPRNKPEWDCNGVVFGMPHYHPVETYNLQVEVSKGTKTYRHHAFFMEFNVSTWLQYEYGKV